MVTMDRIAFGTDQGQIFILPALKLISNLLLNTDATKGDYGRLITKTFEIKIDFFCLIS